MKKLTTKECIEKAKLVHGDKYSYSKVEYINNRTKVCIICPIHGEFWQKPNKHLLGQGCSLCGHIISKGKQKNTLVDILNRFNKIHGDKYDYSKVEYVNCHTKICIICPIHGEFWQKPIDHLNGQGCPICKGTKKYTTKEWCDLADKMDTDYDYSKVEYVDAKTKVCIICKKHGEFWQIPRTHLKGCGCPVCKESKLEKDVRKILINSNIEFKAQKRFKWLGAYSLDFYIPSINLGIECQGKQHFGFGGWNGKYDFEESYSRDEKKFSLCDKNGVNILYIAENEYIDIAKSDFPNIYNDKNIIDLKHLNKWLSTIDIRSLGLVVL